MQPQHQQPQQQTTITTRSLDIQFQSIVHNVEKHLNQHNYESAVFLADKLLTMAKNTNRNKGEVFDCVFLLAKSFWCKGERRRACRLIRMQGNPHGVRERFLAAKCMEEVGDWNECLNILGVEEEIFSEFISKHNKDQEVSLNMYIHTNMRSRWSGVLNPDTLENDTLTLLFYT